VGSGEKAATVTIVLNAQQLAPGDREEAIRDVIWHTVVRVEIEHHPEPGQIVALGKISDVGPLNICSIRSNATTVRRTHALARDDLEPSLFLGLQVAGSSMVVQGGRQAVLRPGDMALYDTTVPYTLLNDTGIAQHFFRIPRANLALPAAVLAAVTAERFSADNPVADLAATYFHRLAKNLGTAVPGGESVAQPSIELIRAVITTHLGDQRLAGEPLDTTLTLRIMEYVRAHLSEHDLSPSRIAHHHSISVRHLYAVLARSEISLGEWIRTHRLEECRKELTAPAATSTTIASVARRWGFSDATHFGRAFREAYGLSPRDWRALNQGRNG
jgi:AraC-like DNA-binding protein